MKIFPSRPTKFCPPNLEGKLRKKMMWVVNYTNTFIFSHLLDPLVFCYNKDIIVNLYKLDFLFSHFSLQPNKRVFYPPTFQLIQPNTYERKPKFFYPHNFPSSHYSSPPTKQNLRFCHWDLLLYLISII